MIYKFNSRSENNQNDTYLEFSTENDELMIISGNYVDEIVSNAHYPQVSEIDNMIIALTNLKNEISESNRNQLRNL